MARFSVRELGPGTWPDFAALVEKHNGVWGGCWCVTFHNKAGHPNAGAEENRAFKETLVKEGHAHAALVYEGDLAVGWCQFGPPAELPGRMGSYRRLGLDLPDWRIPCFFVDRDHRRSGVARRALAGALGMIAAGGGGTVDAYPISLGGKRYPGSFLWTGTESMFAGAGFRMVGRLGPRKLVMRKSVRTTGQKRV